MTDNLVWRNGFVNEGDALENSPIACAVADAFQRDRSFRVIDAISDELYESLTQLELATRESPLRKVRPLRPLRKVRP